MDDYYILNKDREKNLWDNAIFVFDTSALCDMYRMSTRAKETMVEVLNFYKDRIWIPSHVFYEYKKNRINVIKEPIGKRYVNPKFFNNNLIHEINQFLKSLEEKPDYHPYIDEKELKLLKKEVDRLSDQLNKIKSSIKIEFEKRKTEILSQEENDDILETVSKLKLGSSFSYDEKIDIMREGAWRYSQSLPPGYKDNETKEGIQKYGDLIIWKEIIRFAKGNNKSIIFVTNDKKVDWYEVYDKNKEPVCPRHELLLEFIETTRQDIWLFTLKQFVEGIEEQLKDNNTLQFYAGLESIKESIKEHRLRQYYEDKIKKQNLLRVKCTNCNSHFTVDIDSFYFDWEEIGGSERQMGPENEYRCEESFECPHCGQDCELSFHVWEYPIGAYNYEEIYSEGCSVEKKDISLAEHISFDYNDYDDDIENCTRCGAVKLLDENGICEDCVSEIKNLVLRKE